MAIEKLTQEKLLKNEQATPIPLRDINSIPKGTSHDNLMKVLGKMQE